MTTQQQPQSSQFQPTGDELGAAWAKLLNQALINNITLEKFLAAQNKAIQEMVETEASLSDRIQELEEQVAEFTRQEYDFTDHQQHALSEEAAEIAAEGSAIIKEKAASIEAA